MLITHNDAALRDLLTSAHVIAVVGHSDRPPAPATKLQLIYAARVIRSIPLIQKSATSTVNPVIRRWLMCLNRLILSTSFAARISGRRG